MTDFCEREAYWIFDWDRFAGRDAIADQVRFEREWSALRRYANERGVRLIGDVAIYVAPGSADHVTHAQIFQRDFVAGAPPDAFSGIGQLWGNPLYDWPALRRRGYRWWVERLRRTVSLFDVARIDHFRGFVAYWAVPSWASSALLGYWRRGPGRAVFDAVARELGALPFIAEDLGVITPAVERLRDSFDLPGMLVIQFAFTPSEPGSPHRFFAHIENRVVYTGTHDHDTIRAWYEGLSGRSLELLRRELDAREIVLGSEPWWGLIRLACSSPARVAIVQAQDVLGLGSAARMNDPARAGRNWRWQMERGALTPALARRLREVTGEAGRLA